MPAPMPQPAAIPRIILDTILHHIAQLFMAVTAGDETLARQAAADMLAAYRAETEEELALAAEIVSFRLHSLEALAHAAAPDLSLNKILRLRGGAVSLSREAHKSQRKLDQLQRDRRAGLMPQPVAPQDHPKIDKALDTIKAARGETSAKPHAQPPAQPPAQPLAQPPAEPHAQHATPSQAKPKITWSQDYQKRMLLQRMAENAKKNQAAYLKTAAAEEPALTPG